jgi:putative flippase GtrA
MMFLAANAVGFVINRGTYFSLIASVPVCHDKPVLAVAAGAVAGMFINFFLSRRLVFRA